MDFAINIVVPAAQAFIMFSLGLGLAVDDFRRIFSRRTALAIGAFAQIVILPLTAFAVVLILNMPPVMRAGLMLLSFCPGGVSSNVITKLSHGDLALSVSMTAVTSVVAFITVPPLATWSILYLMGEQAPDFSFFDIAIFTFLVTTLPVLTGILVRAVMNRLARRLEKPLQNTAVLFWVLLVAALFFANRAVLIENMPSLGYATMLLPFALILIGLTLSRLLGLTSTESKTVAIETSVQNSPLGITLAIVITGTSTNFAEVPLALPSAMYSLTMYIVVLPFMLFFRARSRNTESRLAQSTT
ncbi:bile acid:sodium symporter family protein [Shimia sp. R11_0]|uniref:bile acid:sodium symporter family protein n=1 Tax=Shimia sp. R11_0 TaxID=2821096 RepID=UPI001ADD247A|nr:bile acid:sodium symporter family protein [Shimia sp. R11_0]MBO9479614.1 bile acid:sodium symporter family protein [Shimia sp. R11_0]